jgi:hypothetical protein
MTGEARAKASVQKWPNAGIIQGTTPKTVPGIVPMFKFGFSTIQQRRGFAPVR